MTSPHLETEKLQQAVKQLAELEEELPFSDYDKETSPSCMGRDDQWVLLSSSIFFELSCSMNFDRKDYSNCVDLLDALWERDARTRRLLVNELDRAIVVGSGQYDKLSKWWRETHHPGSVDYMNRYREAYELMMKARHSDVKNAISRMKHQWSTVVRTRNVTHAPAFKKRKRRETDSPKEHQILQANDDIQASFACWADNKIPVPQHGDGDGTFAGVSVYTPI